MRPLLLASMLLAVMTVPAAADQPAALLERFMRAWNAGDAAALAGLFAADADFVNPDGYKAIGRDAIEGFYTAAFARGYAGSQGEGAILFQREIAPDVMLIDGRWRISGARNEKGGPRAAEQGLLTALLRRVHGDWQIVALRESSGATDFRSISATP